MSPGRQRSNTSSGGRIVYWLLILMGVGAFAPCVLLPEWRQYQAICRAEQVQRHRVEQLIRQVDKERRLLRALHSDPAVIARLARREYRFLEQGDRVVPVSIPTDRLAPSRQEPFQPADVPLPPPLAKAAAYLPSGIDYDRVFCSSSTRPVIMVMSIALIGVAIVLFNRRNPHADG